MVAPGLTRQESTQVTANATLLEVKHLRTWLASGEAVVRAVDGLSFDIEAGETFALLGESGSGKSITALSIMRLLPDAGRVVSGEIRMDGTDLLTLPETAMRGVRGRRIAMIFQEPGTSLNPVMTVGAQIVEVLERHTDLRGDRARGRALELLESVGIPDSQRRVDEYPFQMSGGMKQRAMIAIALACQPALLIADEPTTALDVTIQAQVLELLRDLQRETHMSVMLITHDLGVVAQMAHRVTVMYAGEIVELAPAGAFFSRPAHPYSQKLFQAVPDVARRNRSLAVIPGTVPSLSQEFVGCRFADRCESAWARCREEAPAAIGIGAGHAVRCHL
jgi:peptide/nickel transport system ATP-binding protein